MYVGVSTGGPTVEVGDSTKNGEEQQGYDILRYFFLNINRHELNFLTGDVTARK